MFAKLWRLKAFANAHRWLLYFGIFCFLLARLFEAAVPYFMMIGIDRINAGDADVMMPVLGILGAVVARFVIVSTARYSVRLAGLRIAFDLRQQFFATLQTQGSTFFNRYGIGDMMTRAVADIGLIQRLFSMGTILAVILIFASLVGFGAMLSLSPELTLLVLPPMPFVFGYAWYMSRELGVTSHAVQERMSQMSAQVQENLAGIRTVQAMVQEDNEIARFGGTNQCYANAFYDQARINSLIAAVSPTLVAICVITILGYGGSMVQRGDLTIGALVAFLTYVNMVVQPFRVAGFIVNLFQRAAVASARLFEVLDRGPEIVDAPRADAPSRIAGHIVLTNLRASYADGHGDHGPDVLRGIDLNIAAGETLAIMGRVGAGKTTLLRQLVRLSNPPRGAVTIDGTDALDYPLAQLRAQIALVPQEAFLFAATLRDNITYDDPERALDAIWQAADAADLRSTIESFPAALDTEVGERGVTLSGGQRQRTALARGLIRHAPVLLLDDCFSAVDTATEEHILRELRALRTGRTTILVSHRVSTARHADRIAIIEDGQIKELGSHETLLAAGGTYAELERVQREGEAGGDEAIPA
ncbi:MAG: ABC transporter ATP-binding protein [Pseudomonadota bacterium]